HACDYSDASGMLLLDVQHKCWSAQMLDVCGLRETQMPRLFESWDVTGTLLPEAAALLGLPETVRVTAGAGDNAAAAVGTGTVSDGDCNLSVGTSGTLFIASDAFRVDPHNALHAFAHASGGYHLMGCMLSAASCNKWFCEDVLHTADYAGEQAAIREESLGQNRVFFLPYLMGERSPVNDTDARGTFVGLSMDTSRADMVQAVLEGVAFALRDSLEVARALGLTIDRSKLCGGGAKSPLWRRILANVLGVRLEIPQTEEGPGYGGAMLAMVGCGLFPDVRAAAGALVHVRETIEPDPALSALYAQRYLQFKEIYPAVRDLYKTIKPV
ncbi:MAG: xylulokinase, partial [Clostridia bacterium]|nr:xylulokinase [Clostridia bacterium]